MRLFYASFLSSENMSAYASLVSSVIADVPNAIRSVPANTQHLTITFLGEIADHDVEKCLEVLDCAGKVQAADLSLSQPRILYSRRTPRLVCADVTRGAERVQELQDRVRRQFMQRFPESVVRGQPPHVTLARFKKHADRESARKVVDALSGHEDPRGVRADRLESLHLVKSKLTPAGPVYESLGEKMLAS